jgi:4-hydroxy-3-methylbut-2-enyl diphosphate reductase
LRIEKAPEMGFCFGVRRAVDLLEKAVREHGGLETLGPVVHNRQVVSRLAEMGIRVVESLADLQGDIIAISSHGAHPRVLEEIEARHLHVIDTTCPIVRSAQMAAKELAKAGFSIIVFGDAHHPEVEGILGWAGGKGRAVVDEQAIAEFDRLPRKLGILSQTTQSPDHFAYFVKRLIDLVVAQVSEFRLVNTICDVTRKHQMAALKLAGKVDLMIVVGGKNSANTQRLAEICSTAGVETHLVEGAGEIEPGWLRGHNRIGVTAGASTPDEAINEVMSALESMAEDR